MTMTNSTIPGQVSPRKKNRPLSWKMTSEKQLSLTCFANKQRSGGTDGIG